MSYIRCTSNPEGLYVWNDVDGNVYWSASPQKKGVPTKDDNAVLYSMPRKVFRGLMKKFLLCPWPEKYSFQGAEIREDKDCKFWVSYKPEGKKAWKLKLWRTTLAYVVGNFREELLSNFSW